MKPTKILLWLCVLCLMAGPALASAFEEGEHIDYDIKKLGIKIGTASLTYQGSVKFDGTPALLIIFKSEGMNFYDEERIYMDPKSMYPLAVERELNIWGKKEKIKETYDQTNFQVKVVKEAKGQVSELTLHKKGLIDNIYCFLYRYRNSGSFKKNEKLTLVLPTKDVSLHLDSIAKIEADKKTYNAFFFKSQPAKYQLWFATTPDRLPLRIDGTIGVAKTSMVMRLPQP